MTRLNTRFNWGATLAEENPDLYRQLNDTYTDTAETVNRKANRNTDTVNPPANSPVNKNFDIGDIWVRTDNNTAFMMTSRTSAEAATWTLIT